jgi:hypothetical protein
MAFSAWASALVGCVDAFDNGIGILYIEVVDFSHLFACVLFDICHVGGLLFSCSLRLASYMKSRVGRNR